MKIMIVDDEVLVRVGIKTIIPWEKYGHAISGEAENGLCALEQIRASAPDIVLVDIRMPVMDGLELISKVKAEGIPCKFVILSCLNEFKYVKEALRLGVSDYIIKTAIDSGDLLLIINRISEELERESSIRARGADSPLRIPASAEIRAALHRGDAACLSGLLGRCDPALLASGLHVLSIRILHFEALKERLDSNAEGVYSRGLMNICSELFRQYGAGLVFEEDERSYTAVVALNKGDSEESLADLCRRIAEMVRTLLAFEVRIGASPSASDCAALSGACRDALRARESLFFGTGAFRLALGEAASAGDRKAALEKGLKALRDNLFRCVGLLNLNACVDLLERIKGCLEEGEGMVEAAEARKIYLDAFYWLTTQIRKDMAGICEEYDEFKDIYAGMQGCESMDELHSQLVLFLKNLTASLSGLEGSRTRLLIDKAREFVDENLARNICLDDAARTIGLSPGYFGKLFKRETGSSFSEHLVLRRIERAKGLLTRDEKLWSIARQVGYPDLSSFSRSFKKITGIPPSHFKDRLSGSSGRIG
jgi:two-component system, response regulator YesN